MYEQNISALTEYFASGCKNAQLLGVELEHFVVDKKSRESLPYINGVEKILRRLQPLFGEPVFLEGHLIGVKGSSSEISLEPAAQLEISIHPASCVNEISDEYMKFIKIISPILDEMNCELFCTAYQPKSKAEELNLIPKKRYEYMNQHFKTTGILGINMMRGTAATQVSIDYEDEADFSKKFRVANIMGPIFSLIFDNSKTFEGEPFRMIRTHIWNNVDPARSMVVKDALNGEFGFCEYAKYIYEMPPIFLPCGNETIFTGSKPSSEIFSDRPLTIEDIEHITSMAFPDVRLKNCIEIRMADSMPIAKTLEFTALLKAIFYDKTKLDNLYSDTLNIKNSDVAEAKSSLLKHGENAEVYGKPVKMWVERLIH
ncbi:MAG: glutamate-cysteine ligase family protein [Defluviitaleaceae bacterium]|nr:glutamate-cysteine ligase family protein [Defluviitaleaceae bacterium]